MLDQLKAAAASAGKNVTNALFSDQGQRVMSSIHRDLLGPMMEQYIDDAGGDGSTLNSAQMRKQQREMQKMQAEAQAKAAAERQQFQNELTKMQLKASSDAAAEAVKSRRAYENEVSKMQLQSRFDTESANAKSITEAAIERQNLQNEAARYRGEAPTAGLDMRQDFSEIRKTLDPRGQALLDKLQAGSDEAIELIQNPVDQARAQAQIAQKVKDVQNKHTLQLPSVEDEVARRSMDLNGGKSTVFLQPEGRLEIQHDKSRIEEDKSGMNAPAPEEPGIAFNPYASQEYTAGGGGAASFTTPYVPSSQPARASSAGVGTSLRPQLQQATDYAMQTAAADAANERQNLFAPAGTGYTAAMASQFQNADLDQMIGSMPEQYAELYDAEVKAVDGNPYITESDIDLKARTKFARLHAQAFIGKFDRRLTRSEILRSFGDDPHSKLRKMAVSELKAGYMQSQLERIKEENPDYDQFDISAELQALDRLDPTFSEEEIKKQSEKIIKGMQDNFAETQEADRQYYIDENKRRFRELAESNPEYARTLKRTKVDATFDDEGNILSTTGGELMFNPRTGIPYERTKAEAEREAKENRERNLQLLRGMFRPADRTGEARQGSQFVRGLFRADESVKQLEDRSYRDPSVPGRRKEYKKGGPIDLTLQSRYQDGEPIQGYKAGVNDVLSKIAYPTKAHAEKLIKLRDTVLSARGADFSKMKNANEEMALLIDPTLVMSLSRNNEDGFGAAVDAVTKAIANNAPDHISTLDKRIVMSVLPGTYWMTGDRESDSNWMATATPGTKYFTTDGYLQIVRPPLSGDLTEAQSKSVKRLFEKMQEQEGVGETMDQLLKASPDIIKIFPDI